MKKRYAPPVPDPSLYRPDREYVLELLQAAGLSQRKAGPALGLDERSIRNKLAGKSSWSYPEQFYLEALADANVSSVHEPTLRYEAGPRSRTAWHTTVDRPLTVDDAGQIIVARDRYGSSIHGTLIQDGFGLVVQDASGLDVRQIPIDRVALYTLLDPPSST